MSQKRVEELRPGVPVHNQQTKAEVSAARKHALIVAVCMLGGMALLMWLGSFLFR